jgi:vesicle-fusing ATPase
MSASEETCLQKHLKKNGCYLVFYIFLQGMTNRKDMIDEALYRPGRLEVQMEIGQYF